MELSRQEDWNGLPFPYLGDLPDPGIKPESLPSPALAGRFFTSWATGDTLDYEQAILWLHFQNINSKMKLLRISGQQLVNIKPQSRGPSPRGPEQLYGSNIPETDPGCKEENLPQLRAREDSLGMSGRIREQVLIEIWAPTRLGRLVDNLIITGEKSSEYLAFSQGRQDKGKKS